MKPATVRDTFIFRKHDNIGAAAAEEDDQFLENCFVDTGDVNLIADCASPKRIVVGRTGSGKSALIRELGRRHRNVIFLSPHDLALNFIANNNVISFFEAAGVNLSPFYILLWKHLLVVELLKTKFHILNEDAQKDYLRQIRSILHKKDRLKELALDYLEKWGNKFWLTAEERVHELTERVERNLSGSIGSEIAGVEFSAAGAQKLSTEQKKQVIERGQKAVSEIQIRELDNMISVLADNVFDDPKDHYYVTIDMLDEDWADERIRFKLIRSLIDTVRRFRSIPNVKVILALRQDLLDKVLYLESVPGFQEEKYESLYLRLRWSKKDLRELVEKRINFLIKRRYTKEEITFGDVFTRQIDGTDTFEYLLERTFYRPRDIIMFLNECIELSDGNASMSATTIKRAEDYYSSKRLQSLATEWQTHYPHLGHTARLFYGLKNRIAVSEFTRDLIEERYTEIAANISDVGNDPITRLLDSLYCSNANFGSVRTSLLLEFYVTGLIGIKTGPTSPISWSRLSDAARLAPGEVRQSSIICIHPMFYRALGVRY